MMQKIVISCGVAALLLYGQTPSRKESAERNGCISVGPSGALSCQDGTLDIVTAVVPRTTSSNSFCRLNTFTKGVKIDTVEGDRPACIEALRGTFWFKKGEPKDSMQVCIREGTRYEWAGMELRTEQ